MCKFTKSELLEIKNFLQNEGGHKVSIRKGALRSGERGYIRFKVIGRTKTWDWDFCNEIRKKYKAPEPYPTFVTNKCELLIYVGNELYNMEFQRKRSSRKYQTPNQVRPSIRPNYGRSYRVPLRSE